MATRVPAEVGLMGGKEWNRGLEILIEQVRHEKESVVDVFQQLHSLLAVRENSLLAELDDVIVRARMEVKEKIQVLQELDKAREALERELTKNKLRELLQKNLSSLDDKIREEKARRVNVEWVDLEWRREQLEQSVIEVCKIVTLKERPFRTEDYSRKLGPVWCRDGRGPSIFQSPRQIVIDPISENIFVVDNEANKIKIFDSEGEYLTNISTPTDPLGIALTNKFIFLSASAAIVKIQRSNNKPTKSVKPEEHVQGIEIYRNSMLYICEMFNQSILVLNMNLKFNKRISLHTPHVIDDTFIISLKLYEDNMYVTFIDSPFYIQIFSLDGELVRCVIEKTEILFSDFFTIDQFGNIIIPDYDRNQIKIFSNSGDLIHTISDSALQEDEMLYRPLGIAIDKKNRIVVAQNITHSTLIAF